ncbi:MAG: sigma-70 family RNA polymerase sigma factor [Desulfosarcina sp.]
MPDSVDSDELLVQATGKGDLKSFEQIVTRHQTWAWKISYRFIGNEEDALDIVQEAFLRLLEASGRYRPSAAFRTYFYRIISRLCLDRGKKKQPLLLETIPDAADPRPDVSDAMIKHEAVLAVRTALGTLPANQRMAIVLRYYEDLNYEEIASAMETTPKAVERLLARGREQLKGIFEK